MGPQQFCICVLYNAQDRCQGSYHGMQASAREWPELFSNPDVQAREAEVEQKMRTVRPVVETG